MKLGNVLFPMSLGVALVAGCASVPQAQLTSTQAAISSAEAVGAPNEPQAALHLKLAKEQLAQAHEFIEEEEMKKAKIVLDRAELDAEVAQALSHKANIRNEAQRAWSEVQQLQADFK